MVATRGKFQLSNLKIAEIIAYAKMKPTPTLNSGPATEARSKMRPKPTLNSGPAMQDRSTMKPKLKQKGSRKHPPTRMTKSAIELIIL